MRLIFGGKMNHIFFSIVLCADIVTRWDFGMLAMSAARQGMPEKAVDWLLNPLFQFDDVGMPLGGVKVPTPYFPGSGSLLLAIAMMAEGWDGSQSLGASPGFPQGWLIKTEGISKVL